MSGTSSCCLKYLWVLIGYDTPPRCIKGKKLEKTAQKKYTAEDDGGYCRCGSEGGTQVVCLTLPPGGLMSGGYPPLGIGSTSSAIGALGSCRHVEHGVVPKPRLA